MRTTDDLAMGEPSASKPGAGVATKDLLRFLTCGSVDDGKSTLIGRLLYELGQILEDQQAALEADSRRFGTLGEEIDYALLVDGLAAEREQGITIDVAYRYFATQRRKFIVADSPGHEQYTRNMATGASVSDLAVILVDARKGVVTQTRRHTAIVHLLGIRHVVLAVNKMDLVGYEQKRFDAIVADHASFANQLGPCLVTCIPVAARSGDNVTRTSEAMPWYQGPSLLSHLENIDVGQDLAEAEFLMPVQWVSRPNLDFRGFAGTIARGRIGQGSEVVILPSARTTRIRGVSHPDGEIRSAEAGDAVTLLLEDEIDASRGDVIAAAGTRPEVTDQVAAHLIWMSDEPMLPGRSYLIKCATQTVTGSISTLKHKVDVDTLEDVAGRSLTLNEIGFCNLSFGRPIVFTPYGENRTLGAFIVIDKISNQTVGAGMIRFGLRRAANVHWQAIDIDRGVRAAQKGQKPICLWFTGLSGSGKSTIANALDRKLYAMGHHAAMLDGDNVRHGLNRDLGFTDADRVENIRRVAEVARLMTDAGLITMVSFISPFRSERRMARELFDTDSFFEVFVDTPIEICEARDAKGLYAKARAGLIKNFTGIDSDYEAPENAEFHLAGGEEDVEQIVDTLIEGLQKRGVL